MCVFTYIYIYLPLFTHHIPYNTRRKHMNMHRQSPCFNSLSHLCYVGKPLITCWPWECSSPSIHPYLFKRGTYTYIYTYYIHIHIFLHVAHCIHIGIHIHMLQFALLCAHIGIYIYLLFRLVFDFFTSQLLYHLYHTPSLYPIVGSLNVYSIAIASEIILNHIASWSWQAQIQLYPHLKPPCQNCLWWLKS